MRSLAMGLAVLLAACDTEPPVIHAFDPDDHADLRGIGRVAVFIEFSEPSDTRVSLYVDGGLVARPQASCEDEGDRCTVDTEWNTSGLPVGDHELRIELEDEAGNVAQDKRTVVIDDVLEITSMRLTNVVDDNATLEIEVYAFDDVTNEMLGCAGSRQNLGPVDFSDQIYALDAILIRPDAKLLATQDFGDRRIRLEVWEDDDSPVCPVVPNPNANDFVAATAARTVDEWRADTHSNVAGVVELDATWSRRLASGERPGTDIPPPGPVLDFGGGGGAGCTAVGDPSWLAALCLLLLRRRRRMTRRN
jgi:hypothetical protein